MTVSIVNVSDQYWLVTDIVWYAHTHIHTYIHTYIYMHHFGLLNVMYTRKPVTFQSLKKNGAMKIDSVTFLES